MNKFEHVTTETVVKSYEATVGVFNVLLEEVRTLSNKKPDVTISASKVKIKNRVLVDLLEFLQSEPSGKYLDILDDAALPQISDALLVMVQFKSALKSFRERYYYVGEIGFGDGYWVTEEQLAKMEAEEAAAEDGGDEDDEDEER